MSFLNLYTLLYVIWAISAFFVTLRCAIEQALK